MGAGLEPNLSGHGQSPYRPSQGFSQRPPLACQPCLLSQSLKHTGLQAYMVAFAKPDAQLPGLKRRHILRPKVCLPLGSEWGHSPRHKGHTLSSLPSSPGRPWFTRLCLVSPKHLLSASAPSIQASLTGSTPERAPTTEVWEEQGPRSRGGMTNPSPGNLQAFALDSL